MSLYYRVCIKKYYSYSLPFLSFKCVILPFQIPLINDLQPDVIKPNTLVRCRCMVQDQFDPEYYLGQYETYNTNTQEKVW